MTAKNNFITRAVFVDFMGCLVARYNWGTPVELIEYETSASFKKMDIGPLKASIFPVAPGKSYGADVWSAVAKHAKNALRNTSNKHKRSIMVSHRTCSAIAKQSSVDSLRGWTKFANDFASHWDLPLPKSPNKTFANEWVDWPSFLGKEKPLPFLSYKDATLLVQKLELTTVQEFRDYIHSGIAEQRMPKRPDHVYADNWSGWASFLSSRFLIYEDAKDTLAPYQLRSENDFRELGAKGTRPAGIPSHPATYYSDSWIGWGDFLSRDLVIKTPNVSSFK
jgi:hypothetical protein